MRKLTATLCLTLAVTFGSEVRGQTHVYTDQYGDPTVIVDTGALSGQKSSARRPLVRIRFLRPNILYGRALYTAISRILDRNPNATFGIVVVSSHTDSAGKVLVTAESKRNVEGVLRSLKGMGMPRHKFELSSAKGSERENNEVHIFVQEGSKLYSRVPSIAAQKRLESEVKGSGLSSCPPDRTKRYHNCFGTYTYADGSKYVGEWKDNSRHGQGTVTFADGTVKKGTWKNNEFQYAQKVAPTVTARKSPPPPKPDLALAKRTQEALQVLEIYSGKIDGIIGIKTRLAIRGWQSRNGYPATGAIDQTQIAKLEESAIQYLKEKKSKPKQVAKKPPPKKAPEPKSGSTGSGFFVSKLGHILTNEHVVRQCGSVTVGDNTNNQVPASVLEKDKRNDLALLRISSTKMASAETKSLISKLNVQKLGLKLVPLASEGLVRSDDVELGEDVLVAGYPYGELFSDTIKVTKGIVSANKGMGDDRGQFQMDAAVQSGNSGGPIYDENGNIVGVVVAQLNKLKVAKAIGSLPENVNFGIKASTVRQFLTSAGLPTKWSNRTERKSTKELAQIAKNQTVMVVCNT